MNFKLHVQFESSRNLRDVCPAHAKDMGETPEADVPCLSKATALSVVSVDCETEAEFPTLNEKKEDSGGHQFFSRERFTPQKRTAPSLDILKRTGNKSQWKCHLTAFASFLKMEESRETNRTIEGVPF